MCQYIIISYTGTLVHHLSFFHSFRQIGSPVDSQQPESVYRLHQITGIYCSQRIAQSIGSPFEPPFLLRLFITVFFIRIGSEWGFPISVFLLREKAECRVTLHLVGITGTRIFPRHPSAVGSQIVRILLFQSKRKCRIMIAGSDKKPHSLPTSITVENLFHLLLVEKLPIVGQVARQDHQADVSPGYVVQRSQKCIIIFVEQTGRLYLYLHGTYPFGMPVNVLNMCVRYKRNLCLCVARQRHSP